MSLAPLDRADRTSELERLRAFLSQSLPTCEPATIDHLVATARVRTFAPGDYLYRQGDRVPLTLILDGYGAARRTTATGKELVSGIARTGVLFGWSGVAAVPSSVELIALTDCRAAQWPGPLTRDLARADRELALAAIDSMGWSLHQTVERIDGFIHQDARLRVLRVLAQHRALFFDVPAVLTRTHLPGLVGTTREMTGNVLRQLEREGTLKRVGRTGLELLRPDQLDLALAGT